jgi:hypothetical protein
VILDIEKLAGVPILSGAPSGRALYAKLIAALPAEPPRPEPLFLDFDRIDVATASFLRESVLAFRTFVRGRRSNFYPTVANARDEIVDDLTELAEARGDVLMICFLDSNGALVNCSHVGKLDPMQQLTFDLVTRLGHTTVAQLMEVEQGPVKATAWNNRLASLTNIGIICEQSHGRTKTYSSLFSEGSNGR